MAEGVSQMEVRHKQETRELEGKVRALLKTAKKSNRAVVEAEAIRMGYGLKAKHAEEVDSLPIEGGLNELAAAAAADDDDDMLKKNTSISDVATETKVIDDLASAAAKKAKAQKKKDKRISKDAERDQIKSDISSSSGPSSREVELNRINEILMEQGLTIKIVASDGNCLYRAIADQLNTMWLHAPESRGTDTAPGGLDYQHDFSSLRASAANYLRSHGEDFAPFLGLSPTDDEFLTYCNNVESVLNAEWGGQLEINALCLSLQRAVMVFSADAPLLVMGENFLKADRLPLKIAYHRHFYALGEHYNSVTPIVGPCSCCADKSNAP